MTGTEFRRSMLAIAQRHGERSGEWRSCGNMMCALFCGMSIISAITCAGVGSDQPIIGAALIADACASLVFAIRFRRNCLRGQAAELRLRQKVIDDMRRQLGKP
jgi:hypothetical protein